MTVSFLLDIDNMNISEEASLVSSSPIIDDSAATSVPLLLLQAAESPALELPKAKSSFLDKRKQACLIEREKKRQKQLELEKTYHYYSVTCHNCGIIHNRKIGQQGKEVMYHWIDTSIIEYKDLRFERFLACIGCILNEPSDYAETRLKHLLSMGIEKPYDIIVNFVKVKDLPLYVKPPTNCRTIPLPIIPPPFTSLTQKMSDLEGTIMLEASAYWVSKLHKFDDPPVYVDTGLPVEKWWIDAKNRYADYGKENGLDTVLPESNKVFFNEFFYPRSK